MKNFMEWLDPYRQSFFYFKWSFWSLLFVVVASVFYCVHYDCAFILKVMKNIFVYLPNYLTHEMLGHNLVGNIFWQISHMVLDEPAAYTVGHWFSSLMGNGIEILLPFLLYLGALRLSGGRYLLPPLLYWLGTTLYDAGTYASDASACAIPLTSSDMVSNMPGGVCSDMHDWHYVLKHVHLLDYDKLIGHTMIYLGIICFVLAVVSLWYYWTHTDQYWNSRRNI